MYLYKRYLLYKEKSVRRSVVSLRVKEQILTATGQMLTDLIALLIQTRLSKSGGKVSGKQTVCDFFTFKIWVLSYETRCSNKNML